MSLYAVTESFFCPFSSLFWTKFPDNLNIGTFRHRDRRKKKFPKISLSWRIHSFIHSFIHIFHSIKKYFTNTTNTNKQIYIY